MSEEQNRQSFDLLRSLERSSQESGKDQKSSSGNGWASLNRSEMTDLIELSLKIKLNRP